MTRPAIFLAGCALCAVDMPPIVHVEQADTTLFPEKQRTGIMYFGKRVRRWRFITRGGDVYLIADTTGATPQRRGSIWGPR